MDHQSSYDCRFSTDGASFPRCSSNLVRRSCAIPPPSPARTPPVVLHCFHLRFAVCGAESPCVCATSKLPSDVCTSGKSSDHFIPFLHSH